jgi:hypothetical protein
MYPLFKRKRLIHPTNELAGIYKNTYIMAYWEEKLKIPRE